MGKGHFSSLYTALRSPLCAAHLRLSQPWLAVTQPGPPPASSLKPLRTLIVIGNSLGPQYPSSLLGGLRNGSVLQRERMHCPVLGHIILITPSIRSQVRGIFQSALDLSCCMETEPMSQQRADRKSRTRSRTVVWWFPSSLTLGLVVRNAAQLLNTCLSHFVLISFILYAEYLHQITYLLEATGIYGNLFEGFRGL